MKKQAPFYIFVLYIVWALLLVAAVLISLNSKAVDKCKYYDIKVAASEKAKECFDAIKDYKLNHGMEISKEDINNTGLIGLRSSFITTTSGQLQAKRTSTNPDFASVAIDMFKELHLKEGDEVGVTLSGSFPALNISILCAIETFKLKPCVMVSIGASTYGANDPDFTFYDMVKYLNDTGLLNVKVNYVSLGGTDDIGLNFSDVTGKLSEDEEKELLEKIKTRISSDSAIFIYEKNYLDNVNLRMNYFSKDVRKMKLFINVGGNQISIGVDEAGFISRNGLIKSNSSYLDKKLSNKAGLIERYLSKGVNVAQFLNIKGLASKYNLPYDYVGEITIGESDVYYEETYNIAVCVVALSISVLFLGIIVYFRKKKIYNY